MYYMYVLQSSKDKSFYVGSTRDLKQRFVQHNAGQAFATKDLLPLILLYYEAYPTYKLAFKREKALKKRAKAWQELLKRLEIKR